NLGKAQFFNAGLILGGQITSVDGTGQTLGGTPFQHFGLSAGGFVNFKLNKQDRIQMEMTYDMKGSKVNPVYDSIYQTFDSGYYTLRLNYFDLTILYRHKFHFNLSGKPTDKFEIEAGANLGVLVSYYYESNSIVLSNSADPSVSTYYTVKYNPIDVGLMVGFNYNFSNNVSLDLRYTNSVTSVFLNSPSINTFYPYYNSWQAGHNLAFQLTFRYTFGHFTDDAAPTFVPKSNSNGDSNQ
ncbi:MAG TPA: porin family protein, partial [Bacteroidia bacterium]|nr:porin family protein [Bacteroidia bacterium]